MSNVKFSKKLFVVLFAVIMLISAIPVFGESAVTPCDKHTFGYNSDIIAEATELGVEFKCSFDNTVIRSANIGNGSSISIDKVTGTSVNLVSNSADFYSKIISPDDGGSFFMTFDLKPTDLSGFSSDAGGKTLLKFQCGNNHRIMLRAYKVDNTTVKISCQNSSGKEVLLDGSPQLVTGNTYKFIVEYDPASMNYYIYINGKYVGGSNYKIDYGSSVAYKVQVADSGKWEFTNVRFFNPTYIHGDHSFGYNEYIDAALTDNGVEFKCNVDGTLIRTVDIGRGTPVVVDKVTGTSVNLVSDSADFYNKIIAPADGGSFFMAFDIKPTDLSGFDAGSGGKTLLKFQCGNNHRIMLRAYKVDNTTVRISCQNSAGKEVLLAGSPQLVTGNTYRFIIEYDPTTMNYHIYIDGKYVGGSNYKIDYGASETYKVQVADSGKWEFTNFMFFNPTHVHDKPVTDTVVEELSVTDKTLVYIKQYSCGEVINSEYLAKTAVKADVVYYGNGIVENIPTEGTFWITTDYNIRTAEALAAVKSTDADIVVGDLKIAVDRATVTAPQTYQIALRVCYPENSATANVDLFVDGKLEKTYENVTLADSVALGTLDTTEVRFNYTKVVEAGDTAIDAEYNDSVDKALKPCRHTVYDGLAENVVRGENGAVIYTGKCEKCGEIVYGITATDYHDEASSKLTYTNGKLVISKDTRYYIPTALIGKDCAPYQLKFKFTLDEVANTADLVNNNNGRNVLQYRGSNNSILRLYPISDGNGGYVDGVVEVGTLVSINNKSEKFMQMKVGETIDVSIIVTPSDKSADIYINGEFIMRREGKTDAVRPDTDQFSFGNDKYKATVSDIYILQTSDPHVHSDAYLTDEEKSESSVFVNADNTLSYTYVCYCGETVVEGIDSVIADEIYPRYGLTDAVVAVEDFESDGRAVFAGQIMVKALPESGVAGLVSVGNNAILSVDAEGTLYVGDTASAQKMLDGGYVPFAVVFEDGKYAAYYNGAYIGGGSVAEASDIVVGSESMGVFHIDSMVLATLSDNTNAKYVTVSDSHAHSFDPYTAELLFNDEKTTITVEYTCTVCDKSGFDGITKDLYDNEETDEIEAVLAVIGTPVGGTVVVDDVDKYTSETDSYWFSADFKVKEFSNKNRQPVASLGENRIVLIDANGTLRLADENESVIGSVNREGVFNLTFNVQKGDDALAHVYLNGIYVGTLNCVLVGNESIKVGADSPVSLEAANIKLCEIGNGGIRAIGAYSCDSHTYDVSKAVINYLELDTFTVKNRCLVCGYMITERPVYNNYIGATTPICDAHGNVELPINEALDVTCHGYWTVVDVNLRGGWYDMGSFGGYKNLIGNKGRSLVLVDRRGNLMLGNGKSVSSGYQLVGKVTINFAIEYVFADVDNNLETDDGYFNVYVDGKYAGTLAASEIRYTYEHNSESYEEFGAAELENIKFYNIRSFVTSFEGESVRFAYAEDESVVPCAHVYDEYSVVKTVVFGEKIQVVYTCNMCGERVHKVYDENLYDTTLNTKFVFDENGELTISDTTNLVSSPDIIGSNGERYWLKFDLYVESLNVDAISANDNNDGKGRILLNFNTNNNSPLRLFGVYDYEAGKYLDGCLSVRENANSYASEIVKIYEGESYEFALFVDPSEKTVEIYLDGKYVTTRYNATYANGVNIRFLEDNLGTFTISDFSFVTGDKLDHVHTAQYSEALGVTPTLEYTNETLKHVYTCICGEEIVEGIDKIYANEIENIESVVNPTRIPEATNGKIVNTSYWVSAKVYGDGSTATVYSYNNVELVGIDNGKYTVGGVATDVAVSHTVTPGDYDLISMNVIPADKVAVVYINGFVAGKVTGVDFAKIENFNILLGGGAELDFKFITTESLPIPLSLIAFATSSTSNADTFVRIADAHSTREIDSPPQEKNLLMRQR